MSACEPPEPPRGPQTARRAASPATTAAASGAIYSFQVSAAAAGQAAGSASGAGAAGATLEAFYNWELAAMLIYDASDPNYRINPAQFYVQNDQALADMKRLADAEAAKAAPATT